MPFFKSTRVYPPPRYCLIKGGKKKCFRTQGELIHYWAPRVNVYDDKELRKYSELCHKVFKDEDYHEYVSKSQ